MKINVLGTDYTVLLDQELDDDLGGTCDTTSKVIQIAKVDKDDHDKPEVEVERVVRHELVHAFLFESGLYVSSEWACNEEIVDWIALQAPKLFKAFEKATEKLNLGSGEESSLTFDSNGVSLVSENITLNGITQIDSSWLKDSKKEIDREILLMEKQPKITVTVDTKDAVDKIDEIIQKVNELEKALSNLNKLNIEIEFEVD